MFRSSSSRPSTLIIQLPSPKLDDPTVPVSFRMKRSASDWWASQAGEQGTTLPKLIRRVLEERAERPDVIEGGTAGESFTVRQKTVMVSPNFKKDGKK